jgi:CheY-like chemotaxis protein
LLPISARELKHRTKEEAGMTTTTILLVEDNAADSYLLQRAVRECGQDIQLLVVSDGDAALKFLRKDVVYAYAPTPALIILDLRLSLMSDAEILPAIRQLPAHRTTPIVIVTAMPREREEERCLQLGASAYVQKPRDVAAYLDSIKAIVRYWLKPADAQ